MSKVKTKLKTYLVSLVEIDPYDEIEIEAKDLTSARRKAQRICKKQYPGWFVDGVEEV